TPVEGCVHWVGDVVHCHLIRFRMDQLRQFVHAVVADARRMLFRDLLGGGLMGEGEEEEGVDYEAPIPRVDWGWVDNPTEKAVGWSFLKDNRNRFEVEGEQWLIRRILHRGRLRSRFTQMRANAPHWTKQAIEQYERHAERFLEKLIIAIHLSGGQPARAPELLSIRHRNTAQRGGGQEHLPRPGARCLRHPIPQRFRDQRQAEADSAGAAPRGRRAPEFPMIPE
ncbi:hypothetical protein ACHAPT_013238, partial [Fusarium lateritium]